MRPSNYTDDELVHHADNHATTELERELAKRFAALLDEKQQLDSFENTTGISIEFLSDCADVLSEYNCDSSDVLREKLERADKFWELAQDLQGDVLSRLATLVAATN